MPPPNVSSNPKAPPMMQNSSLVHVTTTNNSPVPAPQPILQPQHNTQVPSPAKEQVRNAYCTC